MQAMDTRCPRYATAYGAAVSTGQARSGGVHGALQGAGAVEKTYICIGGPARNARWGLGGICFKGGVERKEGIKVVVVGLG